MIVYISIGNSDDKLTQVEWSHFCQETTLAVIGYAGKVHGRWFSLPDSRYQNACWCVEFDYATGGDDNAAALKEELAVLARECKQDSIAWAEVKETEFIK
jgi:hypothetical protein